MDSLMNLDGPRHPFGFGGDPVDPLICWCCGSRQFTLSARANVDITVDAGTGQVVAVTPFLTDLYPEPDDPDGNGAECAFCGARANDRPDGHDARWRLEQQRLTLLWETIRPAPVTDAVADT